MVLAMKIISLGFDVSSGTITELPGVIAYTGYVFQVGTVIFGPWISYQDYIHITTTHKAEKKLVSVLSNLSILYVHNVCEKKFVLKLGIFQISLSCSDFKISLLNACASNLALFRNKGPTHGNA